MKNFHYFKTYNLFNKNVREMLIRSGAIDIEDGCTEIRIKSRHCVSYNEAVYHAEKDFLKLAKLMYKASTLEDMPFKSIVIVNPMYSPQAQLNEAMGIHMEEKEAWSDDCFSSIFFCESDDPTDDETIPEEWLIKYEICQEDDEIALYKPNGEHVFEPSTVPLAAFSSQLH